METTLPLKERWLGQSKYYDGMTSLLGERVRLWPQFTREVIRPFPGARILDLGCGTGTVRPYLGDCDYTGVDSNPDYIRAATEMYGDGARFVCKEFSPMTLRSYFESMDIVMANGVLHHLPDAQSAELIQLAHACLKPGGRFVTHDGCFTANQNPIATLLLKLDRGKHVRTVEQYEALVRPVFPQSQARLHKNWLRVPYTLVTFECLKPARD